MALKIAKLAAFEGPNLWRDSPLVRAIVTESSTSLASDEHVYEARQQIEQLGRQLDRTRFAPPSLPRLPDRQDAPWMLAWAGVALQRLAGDDVAFFAARDLDPRGTSEVVIECQHPQTGTLALKIALQLLNSAPGKRSDAMASALEQAFTKRLVPVAASRRPTAELECILAAARARGIPITSIDPRGMIRELGHGIYRRRLLNTTTSNMSFLGSSIARDKQLSLHFLAECGLPVPETLLARDAEQAIANAQAIGFPVVIKPNDEGNSAGVHLDVRDEEEARAAFEAAARISRSGTVIVQRLLTDRHYRVLVIGDQIIGIAERIAAHVVGDGRHTVRELVEIENRNPRRGTRKADRLKTIVIDEMSARLLAKQGLRLDDVPPEGLQVNLQRIDDLETGGEAIMQAGPVHPDNERIIRSAVRAMELDMAGVDLIAADIGQSIWETSGGILEVNCSTGFNLIQFPTSGEAVDPGPAVIETLFPSGAPVRVPLVAVTGERDTAEISRRIGHLLTTAGITPSIALQDGLYLGTTRLSRFDGGGVAAKRRALLDPAAEMAVLEIPPDEIAAEGLAFEQCDVAVVTSRSRTAPGAPGPAEAVVCQTLTAEGTLIVPGGDDGLVEFARSFGCTLVVLPPETEGSSMALLGAVEAVRALGIPAETDLNPGEAIRHADPIL